MTSARGAASRGGRILASAGRPACWRRCRSRERGALEPARARRAGARPRRTGGQPRAVRVRLRPRRAAGAARARRPRPGTRAVRSATSPTTSGSSRRPPARGDLEAPLVVTALFAPGDRLQPPDRRCRLDPDDQRGTPRSRATWAARRPRGGPDRGAVPAVPRRPRGHARARADGRRADRADRAAQLHAGLPAATRGRGSSGCLRPRRPARRPAAAAPQRRAAPDIGDKQPYAVSDETDYTLPVHGERRGLPHVGSRSART